MMQAASRFHEQVIKLESPDLLIEPGLLAFWLSLVLSTGPGEQAGATF
jgi:hypothetical protein